MADVKTKPEAARVDAFLAAVPDAGRRADAAALAATMARVTGEAAVMWGPSIVGFGKLHYRYESGREGETMRVGFSPRAKELVLYGMGGALERSGMAGRLGKHSKGKSCIYVRRLADVDAGALDALIAEGYRGPDQG